jgi:hypothetical protein
MCFARTEMTIRGKRPHLHELIANGSSGCKAIAKQANPRTVSEG